MLQDPSQMDRVGRMFSKPVDENTQSSSGIGIGMPGADQNPGGVLQSAPASSHSGTKRSAAEMSEQQPSSDSGAGIGMPAVQGNVADSARQLPGGMSDAVKRKAPIDDDETMTTMH